MPEWFRRFGEVPGVVYTPTEQIDRRSAHYRAFASFPDTREASAAALLRNLYEGLELPGEPPDYHFLIQSTAGELWRRCRSEPDLLGRSLLQTRAPQGPHGGRSCRFAPDGAATGTWPRWRLETSSRTGSSSQTAGPSAPPSSTLPWSPPTRPPCSSCSPPSVLFDAPCASASKATRAWIAAHPRFAVTYTPKHASWLNMSSGSGPARRLLRRGDFTSQDDLEAKITAFTIRYNKAAHPYKWNYDADADHARYLERHPRHADLARAA